MNRQVNVCAAAAFFPCPAFWPPPKHLRHTRSRMVPVHQYDGRAKVWTDFCATKGCRNLRTLLPSRGQSRVACPRITLVSLDLLLVMSHKKLPRGLPPHSLRYHPVSVPSLTTLLCLRRTAHFIFPSTAEGCDSDADSPQHALRMPGRRLTPRKHEHPVARFSGAASVHAQSLGQERFGCLRK
jgi:hypothetical protein